MEAISAICRSLITPGPLGMCETRPKADAPYSMANAASSTLPMQQIFTRGVTVALMQPLFAVGNPDVLDQGRVLKKPASLGNFGIEPVNRAALIRENLFQIADGSRLSGSRLGLVSVFRSCDA